MYQYQMLVVKLLLLVKHFYVELCYEMKAFMFLFSTGPWSKNKPILDLSDTFFLAKFEAEENYPQ
jgi:hypothetical protein